MLEFMRLAATWSGRLVSAVDVKWLSVACSGRLSLVRVSMRFCLSCKFSSWAVLSIFMGSEDVCRIV